MEKNNILLSYVGDFLIEKTKRSNPYTMKGYHYHSGYEIYYQCDGERNYFIKDKFYNIKKGSLVLINKMDIHCTSSVENMGYERYVVNFNEDFISDLIKSTDLELLDCFGKNMHIIELEPKEQEFIEAHLSVMCSEYNSKKTSYKVYLKTALLQLLIFINRHADHLIDAQIGNITASNKTISKIIGYVNNNYADGISLNSISEKFFISPYYFSRTFKKITGFSFVDYLNNVRIKEAQKLLVQTDLGIEEVSRTVGFNSATHFGRIFKKITDITPLAYKKANKKRTR